MPWKSSLAAAFLTISSTASAKSLWSTAPSNWSSIIRTAYPIGNGKLGALPFGKAGHEKLSLNRDDLWTGGPFENASYNGGNPEQAVSQYLPGIRDWIWRNGTGNVSALMAEYSNYGSYAVLGNLSVTISGVSNVSDYERNLDLRTGLHTTAYTSSGAAFVIKTYCSYPDDVCIYEVESSHTLPAISIGMENEITNASLISTSCSESEVSLDGITYPDTGMVYKATARLAGRRKPTECSNGTLTVHAGKHRKLRLVLAAGTNYDEDHGTETYDFSFEGRDPGHYVASAVRSAARKSSQELLEAHLKDFTMLFDGFHLDIADTRNSADVETADLVARYRANDTAGDPYLESLVFDYGRYLFISSSRPGSLPPNLQGKWAQYLSNAWGADYHANINLQMNYWPAEQTGLGNSKDGLWDYMAKTWAPRGAETARLLYDAPGWVTHNEMNIFGHTGMKMGDDTWADYPASAAWMMQHVWDRFEYSRDVAWLGQQGYPQLLKPIAEFWLSQLQEDQYYHDGTLVVNPCTSPEHGPTTFGCTHYQQLIHQVFVTTLQAASIVGEKDDEFISSVKLSLGQLDKGLHIGSWGQVQEWKLDIDEKNDTHRHLSELIGWYPGWSIASYLDGYNNATIQEAVATKLWSRGIGIGEDANAGWAKVWRSACWARLNSTERAHYELRLTIAENWAPNALSMYSGENEPFQIDANFGYVGAVLSMLVVDLPQLGGPNEPRTVVLGPAIPAVWGNGSVKGLRLRGGGCVDFSWDAAGLVTEASLSGFAKGLRIVNKDGRVLC